MSVDASPPTGLSPFDGVASCYDRDFTDSNIGRAMRQRIWQRIDERFTPESTVLEVGCGTGEDAVHLANRRVRVVATDASLEMVRLARAKADAHGAGEWVETRRLGVEDLGSETCFRDSFDGVLSNFGVLNCVQGLDEAANAMSRCVRPGGFLILCVMGPIVPWEWAWFLARGGIRKAFRRCQAAGVEWRGIPVHYPTIGRVCVAFGPWCRVLRVSGLGALMPPPYAEPWALRHRRLFDTLCRIERRLEAAWPLPWMADHYLIELERVP